MEIKVTAAVNLMMAVKVRKATNNLNQTYKPQELPVKKLSLTGNFFVKKGRNIMKLLNLLVMVPIAFLILLTSFDSPTGINEDKLQSNSSISEELFQTNFGIDKLHATAEFWAKWQGCDGGHDNPDDNSGGYSGNLED
ncbi:hypothetical protein [Rhodohalobacter sulfatireducens]|uniref:Uncharacterized protein n=1 Tax=Rhodohalobacter sulfatireducens TaxID=2911366 RepID=A0ABS9KDB5_9BACT|nr:hypothetical protein [Rhodohalobacter sulfatireducens]MCG2588838.1 hypothetical protein [Rhodohalobacter sulfatireducens]